MGAGYDRYCHRIDGLVVNFSFVVALICRFEASKGATLQGFRKDDDTCLGFYLHVK